MGRAQPHVVGAHVKRIARATAKLERRQALVAEAEAERDETIRAAMADGVTAEPIHRAAHISKDRVWQINQGRR